MSHIQVSVVVPTYNRVGFVEQAIMSLLDQDYENLEVLVIDDGSSDGTPDLLARIAERYSSARFRWTRQENAGQSATLNRGFAAVQGELIGYLSSDDYLLPGAVEKLAAAAERNPGVDVVFPYYEIADLGGRTSDRVHGKSYTHRDILRWGAGIPGVGALVRRRFLDRVGGWDESLRFSPDYEWWIRDPGITFHCVEEVLGAITVHPGSLTVASDIRLRHAERIGVLDRFFDQDGLDPEVMAVREEAYSSLFMQTALELGAHSFSDSRWRIEDLLAPRLSDLAGRNRSEALLSLEWANKTLLSQYEQAEARIEELTLSVGSLEDAARHREVRIRELEKRPPVIERTPWRARTKQRLVSMIPARLRPRATRTWRRLRRRPA